MPEATSITRPSTSLFRPYSHFSPGWKYKGSAILGHCHDLSMELCNYTLTINVKDSFR
jgi:hypothetical protein